MEKRFQNNISLDLSRAAYFGNDVCVFINRKSPSQIMRVNKLVYGLDYVVVDWTKTDASSFEIFVDRLMLNHSVKHSIFVLPTGFWKLCLNQKGIMGDVFRNGIVWNKISISPTSFATSDGLNKYILRMIKFLETKAVDIQHTYIRKQQVKQERRWRSSVDLSF